MTAILLAAGVGKRMGPNALPKSLLSIGGKTLLQITLESLRAAGINDLVIVVGYRQEEVAAEARAHAGRIHLTILQNPRYREGAILSLWTARNFFTDDLLIMDADVLCPQSFFDRLIGSPHSNCILVDGSSPDTGEEQIVLGEGNRVLLITKRPWAKRTGSMEVFGESVGFLKVSREAARILQDLLEAKVREGHVRIEHEEVYPDFFKRTHVGYERIDGLPWMEIDTPEDLTRAHQVIAPKLIPFQCLNRFLSNLFLPWIATLPITPNQWTALSLVVGLSAVGCMAKSGIRWVWLASFLFQFFYMIDNWDGDVARRKGLSSRWGGWFDVVVDGIVHLCLPLGMALGLRAEGAPAWVITLGVIGSIGIAQDFGVTFWAKWRGFGPAVAGDPSRAKSRWFKGNITHENLSLLVVAVLLLDWRLPFLVGVAVGTQIFWIRFLVKERRRLLVHLP